MTKAEYLVNKNYCHVKCEPEENKCKKYPFLERYNKLYKGKKIKK